MDKELKKNQEAIKKEAQTLTDEVRKNFEIVSDDLSKDMIIYEEASQSDKEKIDELTKEIKDDDPRSVIFFGSKAQEQINSVSESMLEGVRSKDIGKAERL